MSYENNTEIFNQQLNWNLSELTGNYPNHWIQLIQDYKFLSENYKINRFLDIGCGCGATKKLLENNFNKVQYTGFDYSKYAIDLAIKNFGDENNFIVKNCFSFENSDFEKNDVVLLSALGDVLNNADELFEKFFRLNIKFLLLYRVRTTTMKSYYELEDLGYGSTCYSYNHNENELIMSFQKHNFDYFMRENNKNSKNILLIRK